MNAVSHLLPCMPVSDFYGDPRKRFLPHLFEWGTLDELRSIVVSIELAHSVFHRMRACESNCPDLFVRLMHARARQLLRRRKRLVSIFMNSPLERVHCRCLADRILL